MNRTNERLAMVIELRDAALALVEKEGVPDEDKEGGRWCWLGRHTGKTPKARITIFLFNEYVTEAHMLNVWATVKGKNIKVLNIVWNAQKMQVVTFRRGDWENELLVMARAKTVTLN